MFSTSFLKKGHFFIFLLLLAAFATSCNIFAGSNPNTSPAQTAGQQTTDSLDTDNTKDQQQPYVPSGDINGEPSADFTYMNNGDLSVTVSAILLNCSSTNIKYTWSTADEWKEGQSQTLQFATPGIYDITLYVVIDEDSQNYHTVIKQVQVTEGKTEAQPMNLFQFEQGTDHPDNNPTSLYFAVRLKGESAGGYFHQDAKKGGSPTHAYPRAVEYLHESGKYSGFDSRGTPNLADLGVGYTEATGFANAAGTTFDMPFYYGDNNFRAKINGTQSVRYTFANFALLDKTVDPVLGGYSCFVRMTASAPLVVTIPMDSYNPSKHKNIARLTIHITNEGRSPYKYTVSFDGFEPKEGGNL